ncbi:MAG: hypothetical protein ACO1PW_04465 [Actinomycetota bacterium]
MASIIRKLVISMLVPYLWRRWRDRDRTGTVEPRRTADLQPSGATSRR